MRAPWRKTFDPERDFTVRRPFTAGGRKFASGDAFDKTLVTVRRLRQLYDQRVIHFVGDAPGKSHLTGRRRRAKPEVVDDDVIGPATDPVLAERGQIDIPDDWFDMPWPSRRALAATLTSERVTNKAEAEAAITAELARREG